MTEMAHRWVPLLSDGFLSRDPAGMLVSQDVILYSFMVAEAGLPQQVEIFDYVRRTTGLTPPVVDSRDVLEAPRAILEQLCAAFAVPFLEEMLSWPPGPRETDGVWAKFWYDNVENSTGFRPYRPRQISLPDHLRPIHEAYMGYYEQLSAHRLPP